MLSMVISGNLWDSPSSDLYNNDFVLWAGDFAFSKNLNLSKDILKGFLFISVSLEDAVWTYCCRKIDPPYFHNKIKTAAKTSAYHFTVDVYCSSGKKILGGGCNQQAGGSRAIIDNKEHIIKTNIRRL